MPGCGGVVGVEVLLGGGGDGDEGGHGAVLGRGGRAGARARGRVGISEDVGAMLRG